MARSSSKNMAGISSGGCSTGLGIDLVDIARLEEVFAGREGLVREVFTEREKEYCLSKKRPWHYFAECLAVKEACLKALGLGLSGLGIDRSLSEVELVVDSCERPEMILHGWMAKIGARRKISHWKISVSKSARYALAAVVFRMEPQVS